jgi:hypothetical protein
MAKSSSYLFTSALNPSICGISDDPNGDGLPAQWAPWVATDVAWGGRYAGLVAGIQKAIEEHAAGADQHLPANGPYH